MSDDEVPLIVDHCLSWSPKVGLDGGESTPFRIKGMESYLEFSKYLSGRTVLHLKNDRKPEEPFEITVHVIVASKKVFHRRKTVRRRNEKIWEGDMWDVLKFLPGINDPFDAKLQFLFRIILHSNQGILEDKSCQTPEQFDAGLHTLSEDLSSLLDDGSSADVELKCGNVTFKAHKNILSARSKVFRAMLGHNMKESKTGQVDISDTEPDVLRLFLRYLYSGKLEEVTVDTATRLYEVGDKYDVAILKRQCVSFFEDNLTPDNACGVLSLAYRHFDKDLKEIATAYILDQKIPLKDDIWNDFCDEHPVLALRVLNRFYKLRESGK